jgi:hypothetical protein
MAGGANEPLSPIRTSEYRKSWSSRYATGARRPIASETSEGNIDPSRAADARRMGCRVGRTGLGLCVAPLMPRYVFDLGESEGRKSSMMDREMERRQLVRGDDCDTVIAEFIRTRGITRCPTACVLPTQGSVDEADRAALEEHATLQERSRRARAAARSRLFWPVAPSTDRAK